jgi:hypothetical protein
MLFEGELSSGNAGFPSVAARAHFHKNQRVSVVADQVDFALAAAGSLVHGDE